MEVNIERDASKFDAEYHGKLLEKHGKRHPSHSKNACYSQWRAYFP